MRIRSKRLPGDGLEFSKNEISRRQFIVLSGGSIIGTAAYIGLGGLLAPLPSAAQESGEQQPAGKLKRHKMGTIGCRDLPRTEDWYVNWLGYSVVERGTVSGNLAESWGAPNASSRAYILMQPESGAEVFIRAVETDWVEGYRAMTTFGWNSFEIIIEDVYALNERLLQSPFRIIGGPEPIFPDSTIHAMQVIGPSEEVLYLTMQTNPDDTLLPEPGSFVDRPFIMVLACPDVAEVAEFYRSKFGIVAGGGSGEGASIGIIARAQGLPEDHKFQMGFMRFAEHGHYVEIDGYPDSATKRSRAEGQLPPGNAMCSFVVDDLDELEVDFISEAVTDESMAYAGARSATFIGPAGEFTELIEMRDRAEDAAVS